MTPYIIGGSTKTHLEKNHAIERNKIFISNLKNMKDFVDKLKVYPESILGLKDKTIYDLSFELLEKIQQTSIVMKNVEI